MSRPLRIAVFAHEFPALSETFVLDQIAGLIDLGHDVRVFASTTRNEPRVHPKMIRYGIAERLRYPRMPKNRALRVVAAALLFLVHGLRHGRVMARCLNVRRYGRDASSLRLLFWSALFFGRERYDVLHCHFGPIGQFVAKLRDAGAVRGRLTTVFHGVDISQHVRDEPDLYRFLFSVGDLFLPISRAWRVRLLSLGCDAERTDVQHMGVDTENLPHRIRKYDPDRPITVLTVGRLVEKKGVEYGLRAFADLRRQGTSARYLIVGDGPLRGELVRLAHSLGIASDVFFFGWLDQPAVAALMQVSDILMAPSVTTADGDQEGIPVTIMEAMAAGMLVVSTLHSGIPELVEDGRSGALVAERDTGALARAIRRLIATAEDWPTISRAARAQVIDGFEANALNEALVARFEALVDGNGTSAATSAATPIAAPHHLAPKTRRQAASQPLGRALTN